MEPTLFSCTGRVAASVPTLLAVPGLVVGMSVTSREAALGAVPDAAIQLAHGAVLGMFRSAHVVAEVLLGPIRPALPPGMDVTACVAALWRIHASKRLTDVVIAASHTGLPSFAEGGPNTGEGLDAQTWRIGETAVSLGTEDGEFLAARAIRGEHFPRRLAPALGFSAVGCTARGLAIRLPTLEPGELVQVQFLLALSSGEGSSAYTQSDASWFAVEQAPAVVLEQLLSGGDRG